MTQKFKTPVILFLFLMALLPLQIVSADIGPKPTMEFQFKQELPDGQVTITTGIMYECEQADCSDAKPLEELGPQRFWCEGDGCSALAYGFSQFHKLEIQFSDGKTRSSNIFETGGFDSVYRVSVGADDLSVELVSASAAPTEELPTQSPPSGSDFPQTAAIILLCVCVGAGGLALIGLIIFIIRRNTKK